MHLSLATQAMHPPNTLPLKDVKPRSVVLGDAGGGQDHAGQKQHPARGEAAPPGPAWGLQGPPAPTCVPWGSAEVDVGPRWLPAPQQ